MNSAGETVKNDEKQLCPKSGPFAQLFSHQVAPSCVFFSLPFLPLRPCSGRWRWHPSDWKCRCFEHKSNVQLFDTWTTLATCYHVQHVHVLQMTYLMMSYSKYSSITCSVYRKSAPFQMGCEAFVNYSFVTLQLCLHQ